MANSVLATAEVSLTSPLVVAREQDESSSAVTRSAETEAQWDRIVAELRRLGKLTEDWDGQGAMALDSANVDAALAWVAEMRRWQRALPPDFVMPGVTGEVVLEWCSDSFRLAAEISTPSRIEWLLNIPGQAIKQWETDAHCPWIVRGER